MYACARVCMCICACASAFVCVYVCACACVCIYILARVDRVMSWCWQIERVVRGTVMGRGEGEP